MQGAGNGLCRITCGEVTAAKTAWRSRFTTAPARLCALFCGVCSIKVPEEEYAERLRKWQTNKQAHSRLVVSEKQQPLLQKREIRCSHLGPDAWGANALLNPFTAPAWQISRLKIGHRHLLTVYFQSYNKSNFNVAHLDEIFSDANAQKKTQRLKDFKFCTFNGCFQMPLWQWKGYSHLSSSQW